MAPVAYVGGGTKEKINSLILFAIVIYLLLKIRKKLREELNQQNQFNTDVIYQRCVRYWNTELVHQPHRYGPESDVATKFLKNGFEVDESLKISELNYFSMIPDDSICYIRCKSKGRNKTNKRQKIYMEGTDRFPRFVHKEGNPSTQLDELLNYIQPKFKFPYMPRLV